MITKALHIFEVNTENNTVSAFPNSEEPVVIHTFKYDGNRMGTAPTITASFYYKKCLDDFWNDNVFVEYQNEKFFLQNSPSSSIDNNNAPLFFHNVSFISERVVLEDTIFKNYNQDNNFSFFGDIEKFADFLNQSFGLSNIDYTIIIDENIVSNELMINIDNITHYDALQLAFEQYNIPYYYNGKEIHFGYYQNEITQVFEFGIQNSLLSISKENANNKIIKSITGVGSSDNIPNYYPNFNPSGEHTYTTEPEDLSSLIKSINYVKLDDCLNLRQGDTIKYFKATKNKVGNINSINNIGEIKLTDKNSYITKTYNLDKIVETYTAYPNQNVGVCYDVEITIRKGYYEEYTPIEINTAFSLSIDKFYNNEEENFVSETYNAISSSIKIISDTYSGEITYTYNEGKISFNYNPEFGDIIVRYSIGDINGYDLTESGEYKITKLFDPKINVNNYYFTLDVTDGAFQEEYDGDFIETKAAVGTTTLNLTIKMQRICAEYSDVAFDPYIQVMFDNETSYTKYEMNWEIKDEDDVEVEGSLNEVGLVRWRVPKRQIYTITLSIHNTVVRSSNDESVANNVTLYYPNRFYRYEYDYDYWETDGGKIFQHNKSGIYFKDGVDVQDLSTIEFSETKNWIATKDKLMPKIYRDTLGENRYYHAINNKYTDTEGNYIEFKNPYIVNKNPKEHFESVDSIKPTIEKVTNNDGLRIDMFSQVDFDDNDNNEEWQTDENGNNQTLKHSFFFVKLRKTNDGEYSFNIFEQSLPNGEMTINMTSGSCGSCNFTIIVNEDGKNTVQVDENGNLVKDSDGNVTFGSPQHQQQDTSQKEVWICLQKEQDSYGEIFPNKNQNIVPIANQDTFVITNILMPNIYFTKAELQLEEKLLKIMKDGNVEKFDFNIDFSRIYLKNNQHILNALNENSKLSIKYNEVIYPLYVSAFSYDINNDEVLPKIKVELVENFTKKTNILQRQINNLKKQILKNNNNS